ncbi:MAG TPA: phosphate ABC transporter substrate-binding protein [Elusimicrobiota bacterium]|nr:phosphate ABC transporter substrate-binding protein [Elusimicrobiota bacterium]
MKVPAALLLALFQTAPSMTAAGITIKGSDTMVILNQRWAENYMEKNPGVVIQVTGGGSGTGFTALINGSTDICAASRPMKEEEFRALEKKYGSRGVEIPVAQDGVAVYLNETNPVNELTLAQIRDIYTGKITNWKSVGGRDARIILYSRENNSGTYMFFMEFVLRNKDFSPYAMSLPGTAAVANATSRDKNSIGYGGSAYAKHIKFCAVKADTDSPAIEPTEENILSGRYPVCRNLFFYTLRKPRGPLEQFISWVMGPEGQEIVAQTGYFPVKR